jgi:hypothetical protein
VTDRDDPMWGLTEEERVAVAICDIVHPQWNELGIGYCEVCERAARAAIKAVESYRVPSPPTGPDHRPGIGQDREQG